MRNPVVDEWKLCKGDLVKSVVNRTASKKFTRVLRPNHWNERLGLIRKRVVFPAVNRTVKWKLINRIVKWFDQRAIRTRDTYQQGDWSRFKKHHCLCSIIVLYEREIHIHQCPSLFLFGASDGRNTAYPQSSASPMRICVPAYPPNLV